MDDSGGVIAPASGDSAAPADAPDNSAATDTTGAAPDKTQAQPPAPPDDPEIEVFGEKLKQSEYKRLREIEAKRKEYDRAASQRFEEASKEKKAAAELKQQAQALVADLTKDTKAKLRAAGIDPVKFAEETLSEALSEHNLTPEQKRLRELEAEKARRDEEDEARKQQDAQAQDNAAIDYYTNELSGAFIAALKPLNLPPDDLPEAVARVAQRFEACMDSGVPVDLAEIAADVADRLVAAPEHRFQSLSDEELLARHPALAERFRKALLKQFDKAPKQPQAPAGTPAPVKPKKGLTRVELEERINQRLGA